MPKAKPSRIRRRRKKPKRKRTLRSGTRTTRRRLPASRGITINIRNSNYSARPAPRTRHRRNSLSKPPLPYRHTNKVGGHLVPLQSKIQPSLSRDSSSQRELGELQEKYKALENQIGQGKDQSQVLVPILQNSAHTVSMIKQLPGMMGVGFRRILTELNPPQPVPPAVRPALVPPRPSTPPPPPAPAGHPPSAGRAMLPASDLGEDPYLGSSDNPLLVSTESEAPAPRPKRKKKKSRRKKEADSAPKVTASELYSEVVVGVANKQQRSNQFVKRAKEELGMSRDEARAKWKELRVANPWS